MPLTSREAFKVGFLARCTNEGLSVDEMLSLAKQAEDKVAGVIGDFANMIKAVGVPAAGLALAAPPAIGALGGMGLAKATDIDDSDVDDVKDRELINAYQTESARLRRQKAVRDYAKLRSRTGRVFM